MRVIDGGTNQLYYLFTDHLGSTSEVRRADGTLHSRQYYRAFGEERYTSGALPTDRTYTGQREIEFGLVHYGARIYDPALGRFAQADAVIPEPWKPVTWDRFSYALSNPIKNNDPTGHCSGDANDPNNPDIACWNVYNDLKNTYKSVNVDVTFDYAFLLMIRQSLDLVFNAFGNMVAFEKALGNFSIIYSPSIDRAVTPPGLRTIFLGDSSIVQGQNLASDAIQVIIHEIGHIFDFGKPDIDSPYKSQLFIDIFNSGSCSSGTLGCLGNGASSLYKTINYLSGGGTNGYNPSGIPSAYGKTSSIDDFSESFTGYILRFNGLSSVTIPLDQKRDMIIATYIDLAVR